MDGGTFTISNGGVFGSLLGTPIINPPQSAILGMHGIFDRPVAVKGQVKSAFFFKHHLSLICRFFTDCSQTNDVHCPDLRSQTHRRSRSCPFLKEDQGGSRRSTNHPGRIVKRIDTMHVQPHLSLLCLKMSFRLSEVLLLNLTNEFSDIFIHGQHTDVV